MVIHVTKIIGNVNMWHVGSREPVELIAAMSKYRGRVRGGTWLVQHYSLNLNFTFLYWTSLLLISSSHSTLLTRLSGSCSRTKVGIKIPDPARNQIQATGLQGTDSAKYAMVADDQNNRQNIFFSTSIAEKSSITLIY